MTKMTETRLLDYLEVALSQAADDYTHWARGDTAKAKQIEKDESEDHEYYRGRASAYMTAATRFKGILRTLRRERGAAI